MFISYLRTITFRYIIVIFAFDTDNRLHGEMRKFRVHNQRSRSATGLHEGNWQPQQSLRSTKSSAPLRPSLPVQSQSATAPMGTRLRSAAMDSLTRRPNRLQDRRQHLPRLLGASTPSAGGNQGLGLPLPAMDPAKKPARTRLARQSS